MRKYLCFLLALTCATQAVLFFLGGKDLRGWFGISASAAWALATFLEWDIERMRKETEK